MTTTTDRIQDFLDEVAEHFSDLPQPERDDLLDDLRQHLVELAADDPDGLDLELVAPASYAAELRRSAGLPDPVEAPPARRSWLAVPDRVRDAATRRLAAARRRPAVQEVQEFLPHLRPAWWVIRGWVLVVAAAHLVSGGPWWRHVPVPDRSLVGLAVATAAIALSVRLGRDDRDRTRAWRAVDMSARVVLTVGLVQALTTGMLVEYVSVSEAGEPWQPPVLRHPDGEPITNLYLFDEDGDPVEGVFVYDGVGRPVEIGDLAEAGFGEIDTAYVRRPDGTPLTNRYPLEQYVVQEHDDITEGDTRHHVGDREPRSTPQVAIPGTPSPSPMATPEPSATATPTTEPASETPEATPSVTADPAP